MKTNFLETVKVTILIFAMMLAIIACKKDNTSGEIVNDDQLKQSDAYTEDVLDFIEKYKDDASELKSSDSLSIDSAVKSLEASMNLMYSYYTKVSAIHYDVSEVTFSVGSSAKVSDIAIGEVLELIEDSLKTHYTDAPYTSKKLIAVMLDGVADNNNYKLKITSYTGNITIPTLHQELSWKWGNTLGTCDGEYPVITTSDAAKQIQISVQATLFEDPPNGTTYFWPNPEDPLIHMVDPEVQYSSNPYKNGDDPDGESNYLDYTVFYNHSQVLVSPYYYDDERCLVKNDQIPFYRTNYTDFGNDAISGTNFKIKLCDFNGFKRYDNDNKEYIRHELMYIYGVRHAMIYVSNYPTSIE